MPRTEQCRVVILVGSCNQVMGGGLQFPSFWTGLHRSETSFLLHVLMGISHRGLLPRSFLLPDNAQVIYSYIVCVPARNRKLLKSPPSDAGKK